ncbi:MAG: radical SAM protein [Clostridia bacterium]|nr:radical SAM protein [Clostridia bacterium]
MTSKEMLEKCMLCPHKCGVDRTNGKTGVCKATDKIKVALVSTHNYEEPCISGTKGSGTIFFTGCNLKCVYCQNYEISSGMFGKEITIERLAEIMIEQQARGVLNINLVTPTMYALQIKEAIVLAKEKGLSIPIVYNSGGYENVEMLKELDGYIDIYLPDLKYINDEYARKYSNAPNYFEHATKAILEMRRQVKDSIDEDGIMKSGLVIRHMILPNMVENTKGVLKWIKDNLGEEQIISVMAQYFPTHKAMEYEEINRKITKEELEEVENYIFELGLENGYIQELGEHEEEYVPNFNLDNV